MLRRYVHGNGKTFRASRKLAKRNSDQKAAQLRAARHRRLRRKTVNRSPSRRSLVTIRRSKRFPKPRHRSRCGQFYRSRRSLRYVQRIRRAVAQASRWTGTGPFFVLSAICLLVRGSFHTRTGALRGAVASVAARFARRTPLLPRRRLFARRTATSKITSQMTGIRARRQRQRNAQRGDDSLQVVMTAEHIRVARQEKPFVYPFYNR